MKFIVTIEERFVNTFETEIEGDSIMEIYDLVQANLVASKTKTRTLFIKKINEKKE